MSIEDVKDTLQSAEAAMKKTLGALETDFSHIRSGRASPQLIDRVQVEYYGSHVPLQQLAAVSAQDAHLLIVRPFDPATIKPIERALQTSELKLNPSNDGKIIRIPIPPLTVERRTEIVKVVHRRLEEAKVSLRNARHEGLDMLKEYENEKMISEDDHKRGKQQLDELIHKYSDKADEIGAHKEKEVMDN